MTQARPLILWVVVLVVCGCRRTTTGGGVPPKYSKDAEYEVSLSSDVKYDEGIVSPDPKQCYSVSNGPESRRLFSEGGRQPSLVHVYSWRWIYREEIRVNHLLDTFARLFLPVGGLFLRP